MLQPNHRTATTGATVQPAVCLTLPAPAARCLCTSFSAPQRAAETSTSTSHQQAAWSPTHLRTPSLALSSLSAGDSAGWYGNGSTLKQGNSSRDYTPNGSGAVGTLGMPDRHQKSSRTSLSPQTINVTLLERAAHMQIVTFVVCAFPQTAER